MYMHVSSCHHEDNIYNIIHHLPQHICIYNYMINLFIYLYLFICNMAWYDELGAF